MSSVFFTPGPSHLYPTVESHMEEALRLKVPSISHRSQDFKDVYRFTVEQLRKLFGLPDDWQILFHASATEIWERLIQNCVREKSFHFVNGSFSNRFYAITNDLGRRPGVLEAEWGKGFDLKQAEIPEDTELIAFAHNETSTGVMLSLEDIYAFRDTHPDALITLDMVSSAPYPELKFDKLDACYFSVQKCFGLPAGLGVLFLNERCIQRSQQLADSGMSTGSYHSFQSQIPKAINYQTPETPNVMNIYLLGKVCEDMIAYGLDRIREETDARARMLYEFLEASEQFSPFVEDPGARSRTVIVANVEGGSVELMRSLEKQGMIVGNGYGKMKGKQIRISNFPAVPGEAFGHLVDALARYIEPQKNT